MITYKNEVLSGGNMKPITQKMRKTNSCNLLHDSKQDVATLMQYCNMLADKINELNIELQETKDELEKIRRLAYE